MPFPKLIPLALVLGALALPACSDKDQDAVAPAAAPTSQNAAGSNTLSSGETLYEGQSLFSTDGRFQLAMQTDGNLVIYQGQVSIWATYTQNPAGAPYPGVTRTKNHRLSMQSDGNLVLYAARVFYYDGGDITPLGSRNSPLWNTQTDGYPGGYLVLQNDGNLVIYRNGAPIWQSQTGGR